MFGYDPDDYAPMATMSDAHREWHLNAGVPMGQSGCPQDACHPDDDEPMSVELDCQRFGHEVYDGKCTYCGAPCCDVCGVLPGEPHYPGCPK